MIKSFKLVLAIAISTLCFTACSEEEDTVNPQTGLVGSWNVTEISYEGSSTTIMQGMSTTADFTGTGTDLNLKTQFTDTPQAYSSSGTYNIKMVTKYSGQSVESEWASPPFLMNGSWTVEGNKLTIVDANGNTQEANIISLNENTLRLGWDFAETSTVQMGSVSMEVKSIYVFSKE